ncbi:MAG: peptidylprolyl isomerase [Fimbriimonas sp.]|nr:peptidylprolyl isomerase [Fimbriimonas sp.]
MIINALLSVVAAFQMAQIPATYLPAKPTPDTVLVKVDGVAIKASDVENLLWDWRGREVTQDLIAYQLIHKKAETLHLAVTPDDVAKEYERVKAEAAKTLPAGQNFDDMLRQRGQPKSRLFMQIESNLLLTKIVDVQLDPKKFFKVSTLVFKPKTESATDLADAVGKAQDAYKRLAAGEAWDKVMKSTGQDEALVTGKGDLGWRSIDAFPATAQAELQRAAVGAYIKPVQTQNGLQLFRLDAVGAKATAKDLEELKKIYEQSAMQTTFMALRNGAKIEGMFAPLPAPAQK